MFTNTSLTFTKKAQIGAGGQATIFLATDHQLNAEIIIKQIPKKNFKDIKTYFEESKKLYISEHHNVVKIMYGCQDNDNIYLAMPYYKNGSLDNIVNNRYLTSKEIIRYSLQFLSGLNNIHTKQLIHFDIKPANILIDDSDKARISDFGLAEYMGLFGFTNISGTTKVLAPPEYFEQSSHNIKFDIYQSGLTLYQLCNGNGVFMQQLHSALYNNGVEDSHRFISKLKSERFPHRKEFPPHIPKSLRRIVIKALKANPNERYDSVLEILNDLSKIDDANEWVYSSNGTQQIWSSGNKLVTCLYNGSYVINATKNNRNRTEYCKIVSSIVEANKVLYDCLNKKW